jgi:hypothetical protein
MRKLITLSAVVLFFFSCNDDKPGPQPNPNPAPPTVASGHWIPNWTNDTLVGKGNNPDAVQNSDNYDIIYTVRRADTSLISYKGKEYYIWTQCPFSNPAEHPDWFTNDSITYFWCYIGTIPFNVDSAVAGGPATSVSPSLYYDDTDSKWKLQDIALKVNPAFPFFPEWVDMGYYTSAYKEYIR